MRGVFLVIIQQNRGYWHRNTGFRPLGPMHIGTSPYHVFCKLLEFFRTYVGKWFPIRFSKLLVRVFVVYLGPLNFNANVIGRISTFHITAYVREFFFVLSLHILVRCQRRDRHKRSSNGIRNFLCGRRSRLRCGSSIYRRLEKGPHPHQETTIIALRQESCSH